MSRAARVVALFVLALSGCALTNDDAFRVRNHCASDDDCSGTAYCDPTSAMCVQDAALDYTLYLQVAPADDPTGAAIAPVALGPYASFDGNVALVVPGQISVFGTVRRNDEPIVAQITFAPHLEEGIAASPLPSRPISTRTVPAGTELRGFDFATQLPARGTYDVTVEPLDTFRSQVPPFHQTMTVGSSDQALSILLPADERRIEGDLVDAHGNPLVGFEVRAINRATGVPMSSIATTRETDEVPGSFVIALSNDALSTEMTAFDLEIRPTEARQGADLVPTYRVQPELLIAGLTGRVQLLVPTTIAAVHWAGTVEAPAERGATPVANAVLQLHAEDVIDDTTGVIGSVDLTLTTDAEGRYDGYVLPGHYSIAITPTDADLAVLRDERELHPLEGQTEILGHVFSMPLRTVFGGSVVSPDGMPMRDATVRASSLGIPLEGLPDPLVAQLARSSQGLTTTTGDFRLELDVGVYDLIVEPPLGSGFAWTVELGRGIGGSTALSDVVQIDAPVVVDADVTWLEGGVIAGCEVRAFAVTASGRSVQVGRATSDAAGHARILVPATIDASADTRRIGP